MVKKILLVSVVCVVVAIVWFNKDTFSPRVENMLFTDIENRSLPLLNGAPVLVNMWTSDCVACDLEMPKLNALHDKYADKGFRVLGIALYYDKIDAVKTYTQQKPLHFPVVYDAKGDIAPRFGKVNVTPTSFLIDVQGNILKKVIGEPNWQEWELEIQQQLKS